jgi:uncharacterized protein (TIGR02145 family)
VSLDKTTITFEVGATETLIATFSPETATNQAVTWSSSDDTVASVDADGLVTAGKVGSTTITVTTDDGAKTADCAVTVKPIPVTGVTLNKSTLLLAAGATETLIATVAPETATNQAVTWSSSDDTVASVDADGLVTAGKVGSATITVTTDDGAKTATCTVTIQGVLINGVHWATTNVAAPGTFTANPWDFGMYYQWGTNVGWSATDPLTSSNGDTMWVDYTSTDEVWTSANDPCPDGWRVPSKEDFEALADKSRVSHKWTRQSSCDGVLFVDVATEKSIFLPASGRRRNSYGAIRDVGSFGFYWSDTPSSATQGYGLYFFDGRVNPGPYYTRGFGYAVRCVRGK